MLRLFSVKENKIIWTTSLYFVNNANFLHVPHKNNVSNKWMYLLTTFSTNNKSKLFN